jgi:hypothetical protein
MTSPGNARPAHPEPEADAMTSDPDASQPSRHSPITTPRLTDDDYQRIFDTTHNAARQTVLTVARELGAQLTSQPANPTADAPGPDIEPLAGVRAAKELERVSWMITHDYMRAAREAGHSWHDIGIALNMLEGSMTGNMHEPVADTAYSYAAGWTPESSRSYGTAFTWTCTTCDQAIDDYGPLHGPAHDEQGHASNCTRHTQAIATWAAEPQPLAPRSASAEANRDIDWEAGG